MGDMFIKYNHQSKSKQTFLHVVDADVHLDTCPMMHLNGQLKHSSAGWLCFFSTTRYVHLHAEPSVDHKS